MSQMIMRWELLTVRACGSDVGDVVGAARTGLVHDTGSSKTDLPSCVALATHDSHSLNTGEHSISAWLLDFVSHRNTYVLLICCC